MIDKNRSIIKSINTFGSYFLLILAGLTLAISAPVKDENSLEKADRHFSQRYKGAKALKAQPQHINRAIAFYKKAMKVDSIQQEAIVGLLRSYEFKSKFVATNKDQKIEILEEAKALSKEMSQKYPANIKITYWYLAVLGEWSRTVGVIKASSNNVAERLINKAEQVIKEAPEYDAAGAYRILGGMHLKVPHIPFVISWPSDEKALDYLHKAYVLAPKNLANVVLYAQVLDETGDTQQAIDLLKKNVDKKPRETNILEDITYLEQARELLKEYQ